MNANRNRIVWFLFLIVTLEAIFASFELNWELATGRRPHLAGWSFTVVGSLIAILVAWKLGRAIASSLRSIFAKLSTFSNRTWLLGCFAIGCFFRLIWIGLFPIHQQSDYATYFQLAENLVKFHAYGSPGSGLAFWPPGYPLFLSMNFMGLGIHSWVPALVNIFLFLLTLLVVHWLAFRIAGVEVARFATVLLVIWPTYFMCAGLASKEMLVVALLPLGVLTFFASTTASSLRTQIFWLAATGIVLGCASLTQPSIMLFPSVLFAYEWLRKEKVVIAVARVACVGFLMALTILPWTVRNHRVFHQWVTISTNGGDVFRRANNDAATGGFTENTDLSFQQLDEVTRSKVGYEQGKQWIRQNPTRFLSLALRKQVLFLGDDSTGAYESTKRGSTTYICNSYWIGLWGLILTTLAPFWKTHLSKNSEVSALMLSVLYLYSVHSVFESGGKYHIPLIAFFSILAALLVAHQENRAKEISKTVDISANRNLIYFGTAIGCVDTINSSYHVYAVG